MVYTSRGTISEMSEIQRGTGRNGNEWSRMTIILDIPGYNGTIQKQLFNVSGDRVDEVIKHDLGDKVEVGWIMYAKEWKERWFSNVDLVKIKDQDADDNNVKSTALASASSPEPAPAKKVSNDESLEPQEDDLPF